MVNDQLNQLYVDMELEGLSKKLTLEEGITSSSSSEENSANITKVSRSVYLFVIQILIVTTFSCSQRKKDDLTAPW